MPILKPTVIDTNVKLKITISKSLLEKIEDYREFCGINSTDEVIQQACIYVLSADTEWKKKQKKEKT